MQRDDGSSHEVAPTSHFRPVSVPIADSVISEERSGLVHAKAAVAKPGSQAIAPPLSEKAIPTSSIAERLRARLEKGR